MYTFCLRRSFSYGVNISCSSVGSQTFFPFGWNPTSLTSAGELQVPGMITDFSLTQRCSSLTPSMSWPADSPVCAPSRTAGWPPKRRKESRLCPVPSTAAPARIPQPANAANFTVRDVSRFSSFADDLNRGSTSFVSLLFMV